MEYFELHSQNPQQRYIKKAIDVLKNGGIVIFPTDTYYGIGCDLFNKNGIEKLLSIKNEDKSKLFSFIFSDFKNISKYAKVSDSSFKLLKKLLPGPYTFILPAAREIPKKLWSKRKTVGIRIPNNIIALSLAEGLGNPIVSTTASNRMGEPITDTFEIKNIFNSSVDLMIASSNVSFEPSSVLDLSGEEPVIVRQGAGDLSFIKS